MELKILGYNKRNGDFRVSREGKIKRIIGDPRCLGKLEYYERGNIVELDVEDWQFID